MMIREPIVAGRFYAAEHDRCLRELESLLQRTPEVPAEHVRYAGGVVPHAGWVCSGSVAAAVFATLASSRSPDVIILLGGVHRYRGKKAAAFGSGAWETPIGSVEVDSRLTERLLSQTNLIVDDPYAHEGEHSLEVQMPFIRHLFPQTRVLPIMVPANRFSAEVGVAVARTLESYRYDALVVGTTDLTHYGPQYGFTPHGVGSKGNGWAREVNDRRFIDLICRMREDGVVDEAVQYKNACSSGAVAATLGAVKALGAAGAELLAHTTSSDVLGALYPEEQENSVGYAGVVFC